MAQVAQLHPEKEPEGFVDLANLDTGALVPDAEYSAVFKSMKAFNFYHTGKKLVVIFSIIDNGHMGVEIPMYYPIKNLNKKTGQYAIGAKSKLSYDAMRLADISKFKRLDRIPLKKLFSEKKEFIIKTRTASKTWTQTKKTPTMQNSVVHSWR